MNFNNKKSLPGASGKPQPFNRAASARQINSIVAQSKNSSSMPTMKQPLAPPVYCPQATPKAAQLKMASGAVNRKLPVAPPIYRPQQVPKVLQTKTSVTPNQPPGQAPHQPVAPPVYRPQATKIVQPKTISQVRRVPTAPPVYRPGQKGIAQPKMASAAQAAGLQATIAGSLHLKPHPVAAQMYQPRPLPRVLQTKKSFSQQAGNQQRIQTGVRPPIKGRSASGGVVQRLVYLAIDKESFISTTVDEKRPSGCCTGSQGDHTTPYTALQSQVANAIEGVTLDDAWTNLADTLKLYQTLPGWAESTKWITNTFATHVNGLLTTKGDINALQTAVIAMLILRNQIALTSLPKGGSGNGEGKWAGSLQYQERQFQLGHSPHLTKDQVLEYIWKAFEHSRLNNLQSADRRDAVIKQHAITMADAYPQLNKSVGIDAKDIEAYYPKQDWLTYDPG